MARSYKTQVSATGGGKELLHRLDDFLVNTLGYSRQYYSGGSWPASYTSLAVNAKVGWRSPSSSRTRFEVLVRYDEVPSATITIPSLGSIADGDTLVVGSTTYEFDVAGNGVTGGRTAIDISTAATVADVYNAMASVFGSSTQVYHDSTVASPAFKIYQKTTASAGYLTCTASNNAFVVSGFSSSTGSNAYFHTLLFSISPVVNTAQGVAVGAGVNFGTNPYASSPDAVDYWLRVSPTTHRYTLMGDADSFMGWVENNPTAGFHGGQEISSKGGFYMGRVENPREDSTDDAYPVVGWVGALLNYGTFNSAIDIGDIRFKWFRVYAGNVSTALTSGTLHYLRHPHTRAKDLVYTNKGQTTLSSANLQWIRPLLVFDESSVREYPGSPSGVFLTEYNATMEQWGENNEWVRVHGVILPWEPGTALNTSTPV